MEAAEYVRMAQVQETHWWFEAKRRLVAALLTRHDVGNAAARGTAEDRVVAGGGVSTHPQSVEQAMAAEASVTRRVLEVGPGTGSMIDVMARYGRLAAADAYLPALRLLRQHRAASEVAPVGADLSLLPFEAASFVLVGCFDVLYHQQVADVGRALRELHRVCAPGGHLVVTDSAFPLLRSSHDVATHAARRFRLPDLTGPMRAAGFSVVHASYFHTLLFPAALAVRLGKRMLHGAPRLGDAVPSTREVAPHSDLAPVPGWLNALLLSLYRIEIPLATRFRLPFGSSLLILARKTHSPDPSHFHHGC